MQKLTIFRPKFDPCGPLFLKNQNSNTLLRIYMYYVTILFRNKMHKIKIEKGVDVTRKCDRQTYGTMDGQTGPITISPTFAESVGITM